MMRMRQGNYLVSVLTAAALLSAVALLNGCAAAGVGDSLPPELGGLPRDAPARPGAPTAFPAVHDMPAARPDAVLSDDEQTKLERDLMALRARQEGLSDDPKKKAAAGKPAAKPAAKPKATSGPAAAAQPAGTSRNP